MSGNAFGSGVTALRRLAVAFVTLVLALLGGCATITLDGVIIDGERVASARETDAVRIYRGRVLLDTRARMSLQAGDTVTTGPQAYAVIRFASGSVVYMRPDSHARIGSLTDFVGEVFARIRGAFAIQTTFVKAGVEGTEYAVRALPTGETVVTVFEGRVLVSSPTGVWSPLRVGPAQTTRVFPQTRPQVTTAAPDELMRTRAWVERLDQLVGPSRTTGEKVLAGAVVAGVIAAILSAGRDRDERRDDERAPALVAPAGATPGSPIAARPAHVENCAPLWFSWSPVSGARDYGVTLDGTHLRTSANWQPVARRTTTATRVEVGSLLQLGYVYRWTVHARDAAQRSGPSSSPLYFSCGPIVR